MADYNLHGLNTRDFQHMIQAIARKAISSGVVAYGDGPDGARDLSYSGQMSYPTAGAGWNGYLVASCKFRQIPEDPPKDLRWLKTQLKNDLAKYGRKTRRLRKPEYYLLATNVRLTAAHNRGGRDQIEGMLAAAAQQLKLKGFGLWDYNDIRGFLDGHADVRSSYGHLVTSGDVLTIIAQHYLPKPTDFAGASTVFLEKELQSNIAAKLQAAGEDPDLRIPLANVFFDLPYANSAEEATADVRQQTEHRVVKTLLEHGERLLRPSLRQQALNDSGATLSDADKKAQAYGEFVIVGGPGQGKSTAAQYFCQLHRAAILRDVPGAARLQSQTARFVAQVASDKSSLPLPIGRRFPIHVELRVFSAAIEAQRGLTLMEFIRRELEQLSNMPVTLTDLRKWLEVFPWILVLDGLDEVPPSSNRSDVMKQIQNFRIDAASVDSDLMVVATTRPQSYSKEFPADEFRHLYLSPLRAQVALEYGNKLAEAKHSDDVRRKQELLRNLQRACSNATTARLMQSPLQVTIMATLLEETGEPPQQRFRLFMEYYRTIYKRETRRNVLRGILSERQVDIDFIHAQAGLSLQIAGEPSRQEQGRAVRDPRLTNEQFRGIVERRLSEVGMPQSTAKELIQRISDGSLQRLVFLVRQQEGYVRFDITSLQEFMAAEALMGGADTAVKHRLEAIAGASYWRNVLLFCIGKCFVQKEHLLSDVLALISQLNDAAAAAELLGSSDARSGPTR